ncbi:carotenoid cleavage dioxygenase 7, chloroplastic [Nicotiana attenuata]|uniref:Carotenoid cleavage dioxygenase 7, chloroplastic n=1 Tax=Nicotiana attenuata TaxID=49451 RepID=A0A1J6JP14_NICAT|nr:carotenoid cleavage dioxygenase 7, chloroplastic [Nicotiana attenuata]
MQAKACHNIIPPRLLPPAKLPSTASHITLPSHVPRAITITTSPTHEVYTPVPEIDDTITAFWDYQFLFVSQRSEATEPITLRVVEGAIPTDFPSGKYYLTGPGLFADDHGSTVHPLDGHGYLRTFEIDSGSGQVKFMARYIETEAQAEERDPVTGKWRFTHRGPFSVLKGGKMVGNTKVMKNVANTSVLQWGGRLFCLWEGGDPYEIDSKTLKTIGKFELINNNCESLAEEQKFNGDFLDVAAQILKPILYGVFKMSPKRLLSHYKIDTRRNRLLIMSCNAEDMLLPRSNFTFYEFDSNFQLLQSQEFDIADHLMIHDWAFTDTHYILFGNRIKLDIPDFFLI